MADQNNELNPSAGDPPDGDRPGSWEDNDAISPPMRGEAGEQPGERRAAMAANRLLNAAVDAAVDGPGPLAPARLANLHFWQRNQRPGPGAPVPSGPTMRDLLSVGFRHHRLIVGSFLGVLLLVALFVSRQEPQYESEMAILVKRERVDQLVTTDDRFTPDLRRGVSLEELNSEAELLRSWDLLERVAVSAGLHERKAESFWGSLRLPWLSSSEPPASESNQVARAVSKLRGALQVQPVLKSNMIRVAYASPDPELSSQVLKFLGDFYLEKHMAVHRAPGTAEFFHQEAERYREGLSQAEERLTDFSRNQGVVSVQLEKEMTVRKLSELEAANRETHAAIAATKQRIQALESQAASIPARMTTSVRTSAVLLERLQEKLMTLEAKRIELMNLYQPTYPLVQEVDKLIEATQAAIEAQKKTPIVEETTDRDPTHDWVRSQLAEAKTELAGLQARSAATSQSLQDYRDRALRLDRVEKMELGLERNAKLAEESFMVYSRKREEARISEALDRQRILNVAIAEAPTLPFQSSGPSRLLLLLGGAALAGFVSLFLAFASEYMDSSFRNPAELEALLNIPVVASIPQYDLLAGYRPSVHVVRMLGGGS